MNSKCRLVLPLLTFVAALALAPAAGATCYSSTPASGSWADSPYDGDYGLAPEIVGAAAVVDGSCGIGIDAQLDASYLVYGDAAVIFLDVDGNPSTGNAVIGGLDKAAVTTYAGGPYLASWNGYQFNLSGAPLIGRYSLAGLISSVDQLGVPAPANVGIQVVTTYSGIYDDYYDFLPEAGSPLLRIPVGFSTTPPPPPSAPSDTSEDTSDDSDACTVPRIKGMTVKKARRKLGRAGCWYSLKGHGRVYSVKPSAGTRTAGKVRVKARRGAGASAADTDAGRAAARTALNQAVEQLARPDTARSNAHTGR